MKHQMMQEDVKTALFYARLVFVCSVIMAFMMLLQFYLLGSGTSSCDCSNAFQATPSPSVVTETSLHKKHAHREEHHTELGGTQKN